MAAFLTSIFARGLQKEDCDRRLLDYLIFQRADKISDKNEQTADLMGCQTCRMASFDNLLIAYRNMKRSNI